jgi:hypothetical protein
MRPEPWTWNWGPFLIYCLVCFFGALATGLLGIPGIFPVSVGALSAVWAAWRRWFEIPLGREGYR